MPTQIVLAWDVDVTNTVFGPAQAAAALGAVPLYQNTLTDPVLGQLFSLTVAGDVTSQPSATTARRTLTLNMAPPQLAPPPFPCRPRTSTPPILPYPLRTTRALPGSFFVSAGSMVVATTMSQISSLIVGDSIQLLSQQGVFYTVASVGPTGIGLTAPYTGTSGNTGAFKEIPAPATLAAIYSTSPLDTNGVATVPAIAAGSGARTVGLAYADSTGAGPFVVTVALTGKRPAAVTLDPLSRDISVILGLFVQATGSFGNSVGQITLAGLSDALPSIPANATPADLVRLTDQAQLLIGRALAYLPPSFFSLAQQSASAPELAGDFVVTTGSADVPTTEDQTSALAAGNIIEFATQSGVLYTILDVTPKIVTLTTPFSGIDNNNTGADRDTGAKGNVGAGVIEKATGARLVDPSPAAPPSDDALYAPLGQFVAPETAAPPPNPPLSPSTVPPPTFLSGLFTQTLQLALAGVPVMPQPIALI